MAFADTYHRVVDTLLGAGPEAAEDQPWADQARRRGLLTAGLSMLANPSQNLLQGVARGIAAGQIGYAGVPLAVEQERQQEQAMQQAQLAEARKLMGAQAQLMNAETNAGTLDMARQKREAGNWQWDAKSGVYVGMVNGQPQFRLPVFNEDGGLTAAPQPGGLLSSPAEYAEKVMPGKTQATVGLLPAETRAYVPKFTGLLAEGRGFIDGQPTEDLLDQLRKVESGDDSRAVSPKGAMGPYQFMQATADELGINPWDEGEAREGARRYLTQLHQQFGSPELALAAYNAGSGRVRQALRAINGDTEAMRQVQANNAAQAENAPVLPRPGESLSAFIKRRDAKEDDDSWAEAPGDTSLTGQAYIDSIPNAGMRAQVQAIASGRQPPLSGNVLRDRGAQEIMSAVYHANPQLNAGTYKQQQKINEYMRTGAGATAINAMNTVAGHMGAYLEALKGLELGRFKSANSVSAFLRRQTGDLTINTLDDMAIAMASELAKVYKPTNTSDAEIQHFAERFKPERGTDVLRNTLATYLGFMQSKLEAMEFQYQQGATPLSQGFRMINPHAGEAFHNIHRAAEQLGVDTSHLPKWDEGSLGNLLTTPSALPDSDSILRAAKMHEAVEQMGRRAAASGGPDVPISPEAQSILDRVLGGR